MRALIILGVLLIFLGFILLSFGLLFYSLEKTNNVKNDEKNNNVKYSAIIMIGPIPIVIGNSKNLMILSILIALLMLLWFILMALSLRKI
ncbi:TIGR00304 family membrane protein [Methanocaldococcus sp.]